MPVRPQYKRAGLQDMVFGAGMCVGFKILPVFVTFCRQKVKEPIMTPEQKLQSLGITLPNAPKPGAVYQPAVITGNRIYLSGHVSLDAEGKVISGKLGQDYTVEQGQEFARIVALLMIATLKDNLGDLSRVKKLVKTLGMVNAVPDFKQHPKVINGFSDLMVEVFGDAGRVARSAVGMGFLPFQIAVEVEMVLEIELE